MSAKGSDRPLNDDADIGHSSTIEKRVVRKLDRNVLALLTFLCKLWEKNKYSATFEQLS